MGLVQYSDSEDEDLPTQPERADTPEPPTKRYARDSLTADKSRKVLPSVPSNYTVDPGDDPSQHQGRKRSRAYVPGELNAHIYLSLKAPKPLRTSLTDLVAQAQGELPRHMIYNLLETPTPSQKAGELHISITHPLPLRRSQVDPLRIELTSALKSWAQTRHLENIKCSLSGTPTVYYNGKATGGEGSGGRAFLALRVGAGAAELNSIVEKVVHPILDRYHLPLYHTNPEYHASFAWCLLDPSAPGSGDQGGQGDSKETGKSPGLKTPFSDIMVKRLGEDFDARLLAKQPSGGWEIDHLVLRAGRAIHEIPLA